MNATVAVAQISNADRGAERNEDELRALAGGIEHGRGITRVEWPGRETNHSSVNRIRDGALPEGIRVSATARDKCGYSSDGRVVISRYRAVDCATRLQRHRRVSAMARADGRPT